MTKARVRTTSEILDQNPEFARSIADDLWQRAGAHAQAYAEEDPMKKNIAYFLELEDIEFNLDDAMTFYRDMKVEIAPQEDLVKYLGKLDKKIKEYIKEKGQVPNVAGVQTKIIQRRPTSRAQIVLLKALCGDLRREGHEDIANRIMGCIVEVENRPAVKFTFEDLVY